MAEAELSPIQIERIQVRAIKFLSTTSQVPAIRAILDGRGYTEDEHRRGWELLLDLMGFPRGVNGSGTVQQLRQREAAAALGQWDGPSVDRAGRRSRRGQPGFGLTHVRETRLAAQPARIPPAFAPAATRR